MNPFRQPSETAVNKTEIECTKIRERRDPMKDPYPLEKTP